MQGGRSWCRNCILSVWMQLLGTADKAWAVPAVSLSLSLAVFIIPTLSWVQMWSLACIPPLIPTSSCLQLIRDSRASLGWHPDQGFDPFPAALGWQVRMWLTWMEFCSPEDSLPPSPCFGGAGGSQYPTGCSWMILRIALWRSSSISDYQHPFVGFLMNNY